MSRSKPKPLITWLNSYNILTGFELDTIVSFIQDSSEMISQKQSQINVQYKEWEKKEESNPDFPKAYEVYENEIFEYSKFSSILFNSTFITVYSKMEMILFDICGYTQRHENKNIKVKDLAGKNYIDKCKKYITKVLDVDLSNIETLWNTITKYQRIRNLIVHKNGKISCIQDDLQNFIENTSGIEYDEITKFVTINNVSFIVDFCKIVEEFIHKIIDEIINQIHGRNRL